LVPGGARLNEPREVGADLDVEWSWCDRQKCHVVYVSPTKSAQGGVIGAFDFAIENNIAPVVGIVTALVSLQTATFITFYRRPDGQASKGKSSALRLEMPVRQIVSRHASYNAQRLVCLVFRARFRSLPLGYTVTRKKCHPPLSELLERPITWFSHQYIPETT
jgi:hypothetical protein